MKYSQKKFSREEYEEFLKVSAGKTPADLVLKNGTYLDVFTNQFKKGDVAIYKGVIAGLGEYLGNEEVDVSGKAIVPGFAATLTLVVDSEPFSSYIRSDSKSSGTSRPARL